MSLSDLKPCPFCGCDGWIVEDRGDHSCEPLLYRPQCKMCGGGLGGFQYRDNAIMVWNTRADGDAYEPTDAEVREGESLDSVSYVIRRGETDETAFRRAARAEIVRLRRVLSDRAEGVAALQQAGEPVACPKCAGAEIVAAGNGQYDDCSCATEEPPRSWLCLPGEDPVEFETMVAECRAAGEREVLCEEIAEALFKVDEKHGPFRLNIPYSALRSFQKSQYERYAEAVAAYLDKAEALSPLPQQTALVEGQSPELDEINGRLA